MFDEIAVRTCPAPQGVILSFVFADTQGDRQAEALLQGSYAVRKFFGIMVPFAGLQHEGVHSCPVGSLGCGEELFPCQRIAFQPRVLFAQTAVETVAVAKA